MKVKKFCTCGKLIPADEKCRCKRKTKQEVEKHKVLTTRRYRNFRESIIERDNKICQRCRIKYGKVNKYNIECHHIKSRRDYPELVMQATNCIALCKLCNLELGTINKLDFDYQPKELNEYV
ncbi:HNH endonuclease [Halobacillus kuroshimensis]|uniref:HNH endonuclease n=1 Tax=Halobacillus kuroshimensis TaxID=302481 RepID=UPI000482D9F5|nr:HNH endonuclease [Halobacillus kuroshimensis]